MKSQFLEDLTSAGRAVWEQYLEPLNGKDAEPPHFPVWERVPAAEQFRLKYAYSFDWRVWMAWSSAFSCFVSAKADDEPCGRGRCLHMVAQFAELNWIHAADNCPGNHAEDTDWISSAFRKMPELEIPQYSPTKDYGRYQVEVAAWHEWQYLRGSYVPEWQLSDEDQEHHAGMSSAIEADLFGDADVHTMVGMALLASHFAHVKTPVMGVDLSLAARAALCMQSGAIYNLAEFRIKSMSIQEAVSRMFGLGIDVRLIATEGGLFSPDKLN